MIERDERLLVMAENTAGAAPWYQLAYERLTQETPFSFAGTAQLVAPSALSPSAGPTAAGRTRRCSCSTTGSTRIPFPAPATRRSSTPTSPCCAARGRGARRERKMNLVAVDFFERGDLFAVVDTLNRR